MGETATGRCMLTVETSPHDLAPARHPVRVDIVLGCPDLRTTDERALYYSNCSPPIFSIFNTHPLLHFK